MGDSTDKNVNAEIVSSCCGIPNLGNTCFFNAATQFLLSINPIRNAVLKLEHNQKCKKNCFVCHWEVFSSKLLNSDKPDPLTVLNKLAAEECNWALSEEGDAANIVEKIVPGYSLHQLEANFEETRFCFNCEKRKAEPRRSKFVKTSIVNYILTRAIANLFTDESTVNDEVACSSCNEALGLNCNDPNNRVTCRQILQRTITNTSDWVIFKLGRSIGGDQRAAWGVSVSETNFRGNIYKPVAWVEHVDILNKNI